MFILWNIYHFTSLTKNLKKFNSDQKMFWQSFFTSRQWLKWLFIICWCTQFQLLVNFHFHSETISWKGKQVFGFIGTFDYSTKQRKSFETKPLFGKFVSRQNISRCVNLSVPQQKSSSLTLYIYTNVMVLDKMDLNSYIS